jgi:replication factor C subunit 3/5
VITALKTERGLALQDLVTGAYEYLDTLELKPHARAYLLDALATTECARTASYGAGPADGTHRYRLSAGASEKMQLTALLAAFKEAVEMSGNAQ